MIYSSVTFMLILLHDAASSSQNFDYHTSLSQMKDLFEKEDTILDDVEKYLDHEEERLKQLQRLLDKSRKEHRTQYYDVEHPIKAYQLIKRWFNIKEKVNTQYHNVKDFESDWNSCGIQNVTSNDITGSTRSLLKLQQMYSLDTDNLARGNIHGYRAPPLTPYHMYTMGKVALSLHDYGHAVEWFQKALDKKDISFSETDALHGLAYAHYYIGDYKEALRQMVTAHRIDPKNGQIGKDVEIFREKLHAMKDAGLEPKNTAKSWQHINKDPIMGTFKWLCNLKHLTYNKETTTKNLVCQYKRTNVPYYVVKEELLSSDPWVSLVYNVIHETEIDVIKGMAKSKLNKSYVVNPQNPNNIQRLCKISWLYDDDDDDDDDDVLVHNLAKRVELITGLDTTLRDLVSSAEAFQVANYGIGGQFDPHFDFAYEGTPFKTPAYIQNTGDRMATFMLYLSDVTMGGGTAFPILGINIPPIKGAAVLWYSIKKNGDLDLRTKHGGCPVLLGDKWIVTKWFREYGQDFRRQCGLSPNDHDILQ